MLTRCVAVAVFLLLPLSVVLADVPEQRLDVVYDPVERTIRGRLDLALSPSAETVYFLLLPNLAREPNPHLSDRVLDASYPFGFDPAELAIESVTLVQSPSGSALESGAAPESGAALPYRLLALPPDLQTYALDESVLAVDVSGLGDRPTIRIEFTTHAPRTSSGDEGLTDGILTWRFGWYPLLLDDQDAIVEADGTIRYAGDDAFPLVFRPTEITATISAPADLAFVAGADRVESADIPEDGLRQHLTTFDSSTRSLGFTLGAGYAIYVLDGPTPIEVAYRAGHEEEARLFATYARDILAHYEARFGAYPRARLTLVENPSPTGSAFAADGILWLSQLFFTHRDIPLAGIANRFTEFVLAHEIAHQWFGLGTGVDLDEDAWLSEGLAQYAAVSYFESRHGATDGNLFEITSDGLLEELVDRQFGFYNLREHQIELPYLFALWSGFDEALVKPTRDVKFANANAVRLYDKGYLVARAIAAGVGEETFDRALRTAFETTRGGRLTTRDLAALLEAESELSLDALFSAWLFGDTSVDYAVHIASERRTETGYETTVTVTRDGGTPQPVAVEATLTSGATDRQTWDGIETEGQLVFRTPSPVRRVTIDPEHRLPDRHRLNNHDPVRIVTAINRSALPLDAYILSPNPTSPGFTFGWLDRFRVTVGESSASMAITEGRHHQYEGSVSLEDGRMTGSLAYTYTTYHQPEIGSPATYWEQDVALTARVRHLVSGDDPIWAIGLSAVDLPSIGRSSASSVAVDVTAGGATRLALSAFDEIRVLPQLYLQGVGTWGASVGDVPNALRFSFGELRTDRLSPAPNKLTGAIALDFATESDPYNLANLAMVDRNRTRLFVAGGLGWTTLQDFGTTDPHVEAGVEQILGLSTLGGLLPFEVRIGIATPVIGAGLTVLYAEISL